MLGPQTSDLISFCINLLRNKHSDSGEETSLHRGWVYTRVQDQRKPQIERCYWSRAKIWTQEDDKSTQLGRWQQAVTKPRILCQSISLTWRSNFESGERESTWSACCSFPSLHRYHDLGLWRLSFSLLESCAPAKYTHIAPISYKRISGCLILEDKWEDNMPPRSYSRSLQVLSLLVI